MKRWKIALVGVVVVLLLALALPFAIPTDSYRNMAQTMASQKLGEPVTIERLRIRLLPWPAATLGGISIGKEQSLRVGSVTVVPDVFSLLGKVKVIRSVEVSGLTVSPALLGQVQALTKSQAGGEAEPKTVVVRRVAVSGLNLDMPDLKWGPLRADVRLNEAGLESIEAGPEDGSLELVLSPEGQDNFAVQLKGKTFTLPIKPALVFDTIEGEGRLSKTALDMPKLSAKLYGGSLQAPVKLDWERGWRVSGSAKTENVEVAQIVKMLSPSSAFSGRLYAGGRYEMEAKSPAALADSMRANVRFEVKDGVLDKVDLAQAAKLLTRQGARGGQTRFDQLSGVAVVQGKQYRLQEIKVSSGSLNASGDVTISSAKDLSGQVTVELKAASTLVSVPLNVSGTVDDPMLLPSKSALAGAAVGTGLLGPGLGTAVGSKAGQALEKLFK